MATGFFNFIGSVLIHEKKVGETSLKKAKTIKQDIGIDKKQAGYKIQDALEYAESIVETVRQPLVILDKNLRVISANHSFYKTFKVNEKETEGQLIYSLGNDQWDIPKLRELLEKILVKNTKFEGYEIEHDFEQIGKKIMILNARKTYSEKKKTQMILLAIEDITDRKEAENKIQETMKTLENSNKELELFAYVASHDLQEPLRAISGYVQILKRNYKEKLDEDALSLIKKTTSAASRMKELINDLLMFSRLDTIKEKLETVDLNEIYGIVISNLQVLIDENKAVIKKDKLPIVTADAIQMTQLFQNLISNAIKFKSEETPEIQIESGEEKGKYTFSVKDNGIGMDMRYRDKVFVIFQRLHGKDEYEGTGIGLSACKKIVERHGGSIDFESEEGKGTTFYFTLNKI